MSEEITLTDGLAEEIVDELDDLKGLEMGTKEYEIAVNGITKLMDRAIEIDKMELDREHKEKSRELENKLKLKELEIDQRDKTIRNCLTGFSVGGGILLTVWGTFKTLKFEETGTVTTSAGRKFVDNLLRLAFKK